MGGQGSWYINNCWSLYGGGRFGIYNNHAESSQYINGQAGDAVINAGTYAGQAYRFSSDRDAVAGIGQLDLGLRYQAGCHWSFTGGYRLVGIAGVATTPGQIPNNFADPRYVNNSVCVEDSLILHGGYLGASTPGNPSGCGPDRSLHCRLRRAGHITRAPHGTQNHALATTQG